MSSNISTVEAKLPPGFRFHPRDDELVCDYLMKKVTRCSSHSLLLIEVDLNKSEPWDIPESACVGGKEWYFYSQRDRKYATGLRTNRATASGYWKATGKDRAVLREGGLVGMRKTLVFYQGRAPKGTKTDWIMHEFRLIHLQLHPTPTHLSTPKEDWVLCRVFHKNREVSGQPSVGSCSYDDTGSSSLPPLMDSNYITFDPNQSQSQSQSIDFHHDDYNFEQVSCFSIFSPQQDQIITNPILRNLQPNSSTTFGKISSDTTCLDSLSCDKKVIKAVLNQLSNKIESDVNVVPNDIIKGSSPSLGEQSPESYLPEVGIPINMCMWNHY